MNTPAPQVGAGPAKSVLIFAQWHNIRKLTLSAETLDLAVGSDLVVLEDGHLDLLPLVLDLLGGRLPVSCCLRAMDLLRLT